MRTAIALALVLLTAPVAMATEVEEKTRKDNELRPRVTEVATEEPEIRRAVVVENREASEDSAVQDMPRRGSFWWVVGAIVVAGVILAVIL